MAQDHNEFVGPGKVFETEEEEFAEYISMLEWATQVSPQEVERLRAVVAAELARRRWNCGQN
jgi:hypothetical protein